MSKSCKQCLTIIGPGEFVPEALPDSDYCSFHHNPCGEIPLPPVDPIIAMKLSSVFCLNTEEFEKLRNEVLSAVILGDNRVSTRLLASLVLDNEPRYYTIIHERDHS